MVRRWILGTTKPESRRQEHLHKTDGAHTKSSSALPPNDDSSAIEEILSLVSDGERASVSSRKGFVDSGRLGRAGEAREIGELLDGDTVRFRNGLLEPRLRFIGEGLRSTGFQIQRVSFLR